jgi:type III pantothenate kinase|tara:strand:- start:164 stop:901 length:738 start_codon:yes stop_codon:yes gene_type:complete
MILEVDAGNSRIKWRLLSSDSGVVQSRGVFANKDLEFWLKELDQISQVKKIRVSSVAGQYALKQMSAYFSQRNWAFIEAQTAKKTAGVTCAYTDPSTLGVDRWMGIVAAYNQFRSPCIIVDAGSAVSIDIIDGNGLHLGGYIMPGFEMGLQAILAGTSNVRVERLDFKEPMSFMPGHSTEQCLVRGQLLAVKSMVEHIFVGMQAKKIIPEIVLTGGNGEQLVGVIDGFVHFESELVLNGLKFSIL